MKNQNTKEKDVTTKLTSFKARRKLYTENRITYFSFIDNLLNLLLIAWYSLLELRLEFLCHIENPFMRVFDHIVELLRLDSDMFDLRLTFSQLRADLAVFFIDFSLCSLNVFVVASVLVKKFVKIVASFGEGFQVVLVMIKFRYQILHKENNLDQKSMKNIYYMSVEGT